jgi:hypothetical protein
MTSEYLQRPEDWSQVSKKTVQDNDGSGLLKVYNGSLLRALQAIYPEYNLTRISGNRHPRGYWKTMSNQKAFLDDLAKKLRISHKYYQLLLIK